MAFQSSLAVDLPAKKNTDKKAFFKAFADKAEYTFAFLSLFLFTHAIMQVVLSGGASEGDGFDVTSVNYSVQKLCYLVNYAITIFLLVCRYKRTIYTLLSNPLLVATVTLIASSVFWSFSPRDSLNGGISTTCNMLFAVYLTGRYTLKEQLKMLSYVLLTITLLCYLFVYALPHYGIMGGPVHPGAWRGVFTHKNGAGRMMVLACGVMFIMFQEVKDKRLKWMYLIGLFLSLNMIDNARSGGALLNSFYILAITVMVQIFKLESRKLFLMLIFLTSSTVFISAAYEPLSTFVLGLIGKDPTLTGRTDIWEHLYVLISYRPAFGYGVDAFWKGEQGVSLYIVQRLGWLVPDAHHGFLDLVLQVGFVGAALVMLVLWQALLRAFARIRLFKTWASSWPAVYILYILWVNLTESSLLAPNSIFWILICSTSMTMSYEAKYRWDFDRFGLVDNNGRVAGKVKPLEGSHANV